MVGSFKDRDGKYSSKGEPNQKLAVSLMNSKDYDRAKEKIMLPIDKFLGSVNRRTQEVINIHNRDVNSTFNKIFALSILGVALLILKMILISKKVLIPISSLTNTILDFQIGKTDLPEKIYYDDEIGLMTKQFYAMKRKMSDDYEAIKLLSLTDPLTKVKNRRAFFEIADQLLKLAHRESEKISVMILDIDHFKKVNDTYGHLIGDEILKFLVKHINHLLRESDILCRFGGEEFIVLFPKTGINGAKVVAEKIREHLEKTPYVSKDKIEINITISIGLTESFQRDHQMNTIIHRADEALYKAKKSGRNRVEVD